MDHGIYRESAFEPFRDEPIKGDSGGIYINDTQHTRTTVITFPRSSVALRAATAASASYIGHISVISDLWHLVCTSLLSIVTKPNRRDSPVVVSRFKQRQEKEFIYEYVGRICGLDIIS